MDALKKFHKSINDGSAKPHFKSEDAPSNPKDKDNLVTIVGKTWKETVHKKNTKTLVMYTADWCGQCKESKKFMAELASENRDPNIVFAIMDGTKNDVEGLHILGYPTFIAYSDERPEGKPYSGDRIKKDMLTHVKEVDSD